MHNPPYQQSLTKPTAAGAVVKINFRLKKHSRCNNLQPGVQGSDPNNKNFFSNNQHRFDRRFLNWGDFSTAGGICQKRRGSKTNEITFPK